MMDIFKNWREGKRKHDERVDKNEIIRRFTPSPFPEPPADINTALILLRQVGEARTRKEQDKETLLWKTLGDYALGMVDLQSMAKDINKPGAATDLTRGGIAYGLKDAVIGDNLNARFDPEVVKSWSEVNEIIKKNSTARTQYGQTQVVNSPTNARVKRQDPLKEELRERRENGVINE